MTRRRAPSVPESVPDPGGQQAIDGNRTLPFVCLGPQCPNTCCGPFHGTRALQAAFSIEDRGPALGESAGARLPSDEVSIFAQIRLTNRDVARLQHAGLDSMIVRRGDPVDPSYYLRLRDDGTCWALSAQQHCTIHPHRPVLCRAFPFYIDLFAGLAMVSSCPGVNAGHSTLEDLSEEMAAVVEVYGLWLIDLRDLVRRLGDDAEPWSAGR